jgi:hypothetical protein
MIQQLATAFESIAIDSFSDEWVDTVVHRAVDRVARTSLPVAAALVREFRLPCSFACPRTASNAAAEVRLVRDGSLALQWALLFELNLHAGAPEVLQRRYLVVCSRLQARHPALFAHGLVAPVPSSESAA